MVNSTYVTDTLKEVLGAIGAVAIGYTVDIGIWGVGNDVGYGVGIGVITGVTGALLKAGRDIFNTLTANIAIPMNPPIKEITEAENAINIL